MKIFYSGARGREDVPAESPVNETLENTLAVFRSLDARRGFLSVILDKCFVLQLLPEKQSVRIELLDSSVPAVDSCNTESRLAEQLIEAAWTGQDVFRIARQAVPEWQHTKLG